MADKRYKMNTSCPQCGCSAVSHLTNEEIREKYGDVPNAEVECGECMKQYEVEMKTACPEWDSECRADS